ncbi:MAG: dihydrofolate reductase [Bacteroidales bacterium]|nr:dihydrofolate reductase [Bacteroidales bacterium]
MEKCIIVAIADNRAIGKANALLWHIAEDMRYFRQTTTGCPVIMGWMTFQSIGGKPLPKRDNVVISIFPWPDKPEGVKEVASLEEAYSVVEGDKVFVMGGGETYRQALPTADKLYITHVHTTIEDADTFFPVIDPDIWEVESTTPVAVDPETGYGYEFTIYKRK